MRILGVSATSLISGAERVLLRYARAGLRTGHEWTIAAPEGPLLSIARDEGFEAVPLPDLKLEGGRRSQAMLALAKRNVAAAGVLRGALRTTDVTVANSVLTLPALRLALSPRTRAHRPKVCWLIHDVITRPDLKRIAALGTPPVDLAIGVSDAASVLARQRRVPTTVIRNGVNWPVPPARPSGGTPIVGVNAILTEWKGQREFLRALELVDAPFCAELLGGTFPKDASYESELRRMLESPTLQRRVRMLGHHDNPLQVMRRWSVAVSSSIEPEAGPLAVTEAMSLGLPVVVTNHGGSPEIASEAGLVVPPGDTEAMAKAIQFYLESSEERERRGQAGRQLVAERYTLAQSVEHFTATLEELGAAS